MSRQIASYSSPQTMEEETNQMSDDELDDDKEPLTAFNDEDDEDETSSSDDEADVSQYLPSTSLNNDTEPTLMFQDAKTCYDIVSSYSGSMPASSLRWWQLIWITAKVSFSLRPSIVALMLLLAALSASLRILSPWAFQKMIDAVATSTTTITSVNGVLDTQSWLLTLGACFAAAHFGFSVLEVALSRVCQCFAFWLEDVWHTAAIHHTLRLPMAFHHRNDSGALASRIQRGSSEIGRLCMSLLGDDVLISLFSVVSSVAMAISILPEVWWIFLAPIPIYVFATHYFEKKSQLHFLAYRPLADIVDTSRSDAFRSIATVKLFGREQHETLQLTRIFTVMRTKEISGEIMYFFKRVIEETLEMSAKFVLVAYCLPRVQAGELTIGQIAFLLSLQTSCFTPLDRVNNCIVDTNIALRKIRPLVGVLLQPDELKDRPNAVDLPRLSEGLKLENVTFEYANKKKKSSNPVLRGLNLTIRRGTMTAIVGRSGAGKSTLASLLLRFYDPLEGQILWDSIDLRNTTRASRHKEIAVVPQDAALFNRSIKENIAFGRPDATHEEIVEAARVANAHDFITQQLSEGYDSIVGERGVLLSGGQRQRLAIARAILMKPSLLILDESTSNLDSESEHAIQTALETMQVPIKVVIAHRLSTVVNADQIVVLDDGRVVACGKHDQLRETCPLYERLCQLQFGSNASEPFKVNV